MSERTRALAQAAAELSEDERAELVEEILRTLNAPVSDDAAEQAWHAEIDRRSQELEQGAVEEIPWERVQAETQQILGWRR